MKKIIVILLLSLFVFEGYSQIDSIYFDQEYLEEYSNTEIDTLEIYAKILHLDSAQTKIGFFFLGAFGGSALTGIINKLESTKLIAPVGIIFIVWICTNQYFNIRIRILENKVFRAIEN